MDPVEDYGIGHLSSVLSLTVTAMKGRSARALTISESRTPYATGGEYFAKGSRDDVVSTVYEMMQERDPARYRAL